MIGEIKVDPLSQEQEWTESNTCGEDRSYSSTINVCTSFVVARMVLMADVRILKELNRSDFSNVDVRENKLRRYLDDVQTRLRCSHHDANIQKEEKEACLNYIRALNAATSFLRQKAKESWLKDGDQNTSLFHNAIKARQYRNIILRIEIEDGQMVEDQQGDMGGL
ncbi:hypothetical protein RIF29_20645 [Crotalaria pallida]|uniref:Uncharacterized protein n=1 Tax=Crotalaria pallida TaxID=3830 RepID=A0AAN9F3E0_CROPI